MAAIVYPLDFPNVGLQSMTADPRVAIAAGESPFTFEEQVYEWDGAIWAFSAVAVPEFKAQAAELITFKMKLRGKKGTFLLGDPGYQGPRGVLGGSPVVDGAGQAGDQLLTRGWVADTAGVLLKMDYLQRGEGLSSRLHMVLDDADSDATGRATLRIWPPIPPGLGPSDGAPLVVTAPRGLMRAQTNDLGWTLDSALHHGAQLSYRSVV